MLKIFNEKINFAMETIYEAGELIRKRLKNRMEITVKTDVNDLVTNVDKETEKFLVEKINNKYPLDTFITEENTVATNFGDKCWIIDPIDGTFNFIYEKKNFAISAAYYESNTPVFGIVYDVSDDNMYLGIKGGGAFLNGKKIIPSSPRTLENSIIDVNLKRKKIIEKLIGLNIEKLCLHSLEHRHLGSAALRLCHLAVNRIHIYISVNLALWDYAAGGIILRECGGDYHVEKFINHKSPSSNTILIAAQNNKLLEEVLNFCTNK